MTPLRIGTMVTSHYTAPPPEDVIYAPIEIATAVAEGLQQRGHHVTFFGPKGSRLKVERIVSGNLPPLLQNDHLQFIGGENIGGVEHEKIKHLWDQYLISLMYQEVVRKQFDIFHVHPVDRVLPLAYTIRDTPVVYTLHDPIFPWRKEIFQLFRSSNQHYISISDSQRQPAPDLPWAATIYNGIDLSRFPFREKNGEYLLFVGRLVSQKGVADAIAAVEKNNERLLIVGAPASGTYWDKHIRPHLSNTIRYEGMVPREKLHEYYKNAKAFLFPIQWEEPFGLVMIEAMACGTPVIAFNRGSVPEVIKDGKTGFIVSTVDEMSVAIKKIDQIDRRACRAHVEEHFGVERMIDEYERVFLKLAASR